VQNAITRPVAQGLLHLLGRGPHSGDE
jgi:hypothetical protein